MMNIIHKEKNTYIVLDNTTPTKVYTTGIGLVYTDDEENITGYSINWDDINPEEIQTFLTHALTTINDGTLEINIELEKEYNHRNLIRQYTTDTNTTGEE